MLLDFMLGNVVSQLYEVTLIEAKTSKGQGSEPKGVVINRDGDPCVGLKKIGKLITADRTCRLPAARSLLLIGRHVKNHVSFTI